jgi:outer membrane protein
VHRAIRPICAVAFAAFCAASAAAQEPLTLDRAVQTALAQNASLRAARAGADEAAAHAAEARSAFFPRFSVAESWQRGDQPVFVFSSLLSARRFAASNFAIDALNHPDPIGFFHLSAGVEQVLFDGGRTRAAADAAGSAREAAGASSGEAAAGVALATTQTFGRVLTNQAARRTADAALAAAREDLARVERRRDAGVATDADVLALAVHVADLEQRAIQAGGEARIAIAELNRLMGAPIDRDLQVEEPAPAGQAVETADLAALFAQADAARPEIARAAAAERSAGSARRLARAAFVPQIAAQASFDVAGTRVADRASSWVVGAELRWHVSAGGAELAGMKAAAASAARAHAEAEEARAAVHVDVITALRRVESARARQAVGRAAVEQARESQRIVRDRFEAGVAGVSDVLRASAAVVDADANRISALVDVIVGTAMLRRALGRTP